MLFSATIAQKSDENQRDNSTPNKTDEASHLITEKPTEIPDKITSSKDKDLKNTKSPSMKSTTIFINTNSRSKTKDNIVKKDKPSARTVQNGDRQQNDADNANMELSPSNVRDLAPSQQQNENVQRAVVPKTEPRATATAGSPAGRQPSCDQRTNKGCDVINFERCDNRGSCRCLRGFMRNGQTNKCVGQFKSLLKQYN